jgi:3-phosphoshikimate 1-carboxyvinyltransferase
MKIQPAKSITGKIDLPGDKSISHRAALIAAMAWGETRIENFSTSADCASTLSCLKDLGVEIRKENSTIFIKGVGKTGFRKPEKALDCGNSGTTMRLLAGILAGQNFESTLVGDESLSKRPMQRIIEPLEMMGAKIESENGCPPLKIHGKNPLQAICYELPVASAQVKSCVLLAGLNASGKTSVSEPSLTRDHTERMLRFFGAEIETKEGTICISGERDLTATDLKIPSDISSAAFFIVAAACLEGSDLVIKNVGLNPTRTAFIDVLRRIGAKIEFFDPREICNEPCANLRVFGGADLQSNSGSNVIRDKIIANLIDEIPILAIFGTQMENGLEIRDAGELRVKESDRISGTVENLRRMNAKIEEFPDGFRVEKSNLKGAKIDSFGDHRIAMAFAIAALFAEGETEIEGAECVDVSFPGFFEALAKIRND